jgi:hypothetical protein
MPKMSFDHQPTTCCSFRIPTSWSRFSRKSVAEICYFAVHAVAWTLANLAGPAFGEYNR